MAKLKERVKAKMKDFSDFCRENPQVVALGLVIGGKALWEVGRAASRHHQKMMRLEQLTTVYDPATGLRWRLRKPMTNRQNRDLIALMRATGMSKVEALSQMGLLKR